MSRAILSGCLIAAGALVAGCGRPPDGPEPKPTGPKAGGKADEEIKEYPNGEFPPSLVQLLAHPDRYHGKHVRVKGFLHVRFEGTAIYLSREDAEHGITRNGFWVSFDPKAVPFEGGVEPKQLDGKYVLIEGTFDKTAFGHLGLWAGSIQQVTRAYELRRRP